MFFNFVRDIKMGNENKTKIFNERLAGQPEADSLDKKTTI